MTDRAQGRLGQLWVSIATTDRSAALAALCWDLVEQTREAGVALTLAIVENSCLVAEREATCAALALIRQCGVHVHLDTGGPSGQTIAASRRRQREQLQSLLCGQEGPDVIWMLDDDMRLLHAQVTIDGLVTTRLHNHVAFLFSIARNQPTLDLLVGEVSGDPPIPAMATLASRYGDFVRLANAMASMNPDAVWRVPSAGVETMRRADFYYDFVDATLANAGEVAWLPRARAPVATARDAWREVCVEAGHIPAGIAFTRPIPAQPERFGQLIPGWCRGGNAVFFNLESCLAHRYPSLALCGVHTRRGDMVGSTLLARERPGRVMQSGFSVLHQRVRQGGSFPLMPALESLVLSDSLGSALAHAVAEGDGATGPRVLSGLKKRVAQIDAALAHCHSALAALRLLIPVLPHWMRDAVPSATLGQVWAGMDWAESQVPGCAEGRLPASLRTSLSSRDTADSIANFAFRLLNDREVE